MKPDTPQIICIGEPLIEFNESTPGVFQKGFGGDTSHVAIAAARQGALVGYCTRVGDDPFGKDLMALWSSEGIDTRWAIRDTDAATGALFRNA